MIEVKNVSKRFEQVCALDGLTMTVPTGAVYGLVIAMYQRMSSIQRTRSKALRRYSLSCLSSVRQALATRR